MEQHRGGMPSEEALTFVRYPWLFIHQRWCYNQLAMDPDTLQSNQSGSATASKAVTTPARILYFDHTSSMSGGEIALFNLLTELDGQRFLPIVVLCREGPLSDKLRAAGISTRILKLDESVLNTRKESLGLSTLLRVKQISNTVLYTFQLSKLIKEQRADLVHTNSLKADIIGGVAARLAGVPVIWHIRDRITADYLSPNVASMFRMLGKFIPNFVIANSHSTLSTMNLKKPGKTAAIYSGIKYRGRIRNIENAEESGVVHDGVSADGVPNDSQNPAKSRDLLRNSAAARIGLIGRLSPWKGQHIFIRSAVDVIRKFPQAKFIIIGSALFDESAYEEEIRKLRRDLNLENSVEFAGFRSDIVDVISDLDIVVHASTIGEPFGQVIVEGMASGKPVIATNGGGVPEIIQDGINGLLIPMDDVNALTEAICSLLADPEKSAQLARQGRARVEQFFLIEQTVRKVEAVYDNLLKDSRRRS